MRIVSLSDIKEELQSHLRRKELFPIIGSGFTRGAQTKSKHTVPSGSDMIEYMEDYLKGKGFPELQHHNFAQVARYFEKVATPDDFRKYFQKHFIGVKLPQVKKDFLNAGWRFIYTLNLDDAIENNSEYTTKVTPGHDLWLETLDDEKCVFKLHGDAQELIKYKDSSQVLTITEYIASLDSNELLLHKLTEDLSYSNTLFVGCSLTDELDLRSVATRIQTRSSQKKNCYFVTSHEPDQLQQIDLEDFGVDTVILVSNYNDFYIEFSKLAKAAYCVQEDQLEEFRNIPRENAPAEKSIDYLLFGKHLLDKQKHKIYYPSFFIQRDLSQTLLEEMDSLRIQIVHGARISGKSYLLAGLLQLVSNRDTYYFDSRNSIDLPLLKLILTQKRSVILFDTNVLTKSAMKYLLEFPQVDLERDDIHVVCCVNNSDRDILSIISYVCQYSSLPVEHIKTYSLDKYLSTADKGRELEQLNSKLKINKITPFIKKLSILDNLLQIKQDMPKSTSFKNVQFDSDISVTSNDSGKIALLVLLVQNEKISAQQIIQCRLTKESVDLLKELKLTVEEDHRSQLQLSTLDSASYQLVSNATFWLLSQLHTISQYKSLRGTIVEAFQLLIQSFLGNTRRYKNVENLVKFDKLNEIFPDGKGLILEIYDGLRSMLLESYQYFHQVAKCRLWGLNKPSYNKKELAQAKVDAITAYKMALEVHEDNPEAISHRVAFAHILFTLTVIHTKSCIEENFEDLDTLCATFDYFSQAITYVENYDAMKEVKRNAIEKSRGNKNNEENSVVYEWMSLMVRGKGNVPANKQRKWSAISSYWQSL